MNYIEELKERRNRIHNHGTCECCDNWTKIRDIELAEVDRRAREELDEAVMVYLGRNFPPHTAQRLHKGIKEHLTNLTPKQ